MAFGHDSSLKEGAEALRRKGGQSMIAPYDFCGSANNSENVCNGGMRASRPTQGLTSGAETPNYA